MEKQVAKLNNLRIAPRKVRLLASLIRGLSVNEAEAQLLMQIKRPAKPLIKLLRSAVANAKNNKQMSGDDLFIEKITVDGGMMLKRFMPRARGTAAEIQKKSSHITIVLASSLTPVGTRFKMNGNSSTKIVEKKEKSPKPKSNTKTKKLEVENSKVSAKSEVKNTDSSKQIRRKVV